MAYIDRSLAGWRVLATHSHTRLWELLPSPWRVRLPSHGAAGRHGTSIRYFTSIEQLSWWFCSIFMAFLRVDATLFFGMAAYLVALLGSARLAEPQRLEL